MHIKGDISLFIFVFPQLVVPTNDVRFIFHQKLFQYFQFCYHYQTEKQNYGLSFYPQLQVDHGLI